MISTPFELKEEQKKMKKQKDMTFFGVESDEEMKTESTQIKKQKNNKRKRLFYA